MEAIVITPYGGSGIPDVDEWYPLIRDVYSGRIDDYTGRMFNVPSHNLLVVKIPDIDGPDLAVIKSDNRFFVLSPGPGNSGNALTTWLSGKGANGHGVTNSDTAEEATSKLREHFRTAP